MSMHHDDSFRPRRNANVIYNDEGAITANTLTVSVKGLKGADAANYSLAAETKTFEYTVEPKTVSVRSIAIGSKSIVQCVSPR